MSDMMLENVKALASLGEVIKWYGQGYKLSFPDSLE